MKTLGWVEGFEPSTTGTTIRRSTKLSYTHRAGNEHFSLTCVQRTAATAMAQEKAQEIRDSRNSDRRELIFRNAQPSHRDFRIVSEAKAVDAVRRFELARRHQRGFIVARNHRSVDRALDAVALYG